MRKKYFNLVLSVVLVLVCILSDFFGMVVCAESDATTRQKAYIEFAANKATVSEEEITSLTKDEMRILGVFLSNFYIPWGTQLIETDDDDESRKQMVQVLTESLKFDETLAEDIVDAVFKLSIDSASKLYTQFNFTVYECDTDGDRLDGTSSKKLIEKKDLCYYDLLSLPSYAYDVCGKDWYVDKDCYVIKESEGSWYYTDIDGKIAFDEQYDTSKGIYELNFDTISLVTDSGKEVFAFEDDNDADEIALSVCLKNLNMSKGMGLNLLATSEDIATKFSGDSQLEALVESLSSAEYIYNISSFGWELYVDCFGNIIVDCGVGRQYVLMPACLNPYVWKKDGLEVGQALPMNNLAMFSESLDGNLWYDTVSAPSSPLTSSDSSDSAISSPTESAESSVKLKINCESDNSDIKNWRILRGTTADSLQSGWWNSPWSKSVSDKVSDIILGQYNRGNHLYELTVNTNVAQNIAKKLLGADFSASMVSTDDILDYWFCRKGISPDYTIQDFILFDNLNAFSNDTPMAINPYGIFNDASGTPLGGESMKTGFKNYLFDPKDNALVQMSTDEQKKYIAGIYCAYVFAYFENKGTDDGGHVNFRFCPDSLPDVGSGTIQLTDTSLLDMQKDVLVMSYNLLHPEEGVAYVSKLATTKLEGMLLSWHSDLVGNVNTGSTTGATRYVGVSSYMTTPEISDVGWLNSLFSLYTSHVVYVLLFILIIMIVYAISGHIGWQRAVVNTFCFGFCIYAVPMSISTGISLANNLTDLFYNNKFTYWAIVQHQAYQEDLKKAISEKNYDDYLVTLFGQQGFSYDSHVVNLKWMCPKKDNYLVNIEKELTESTSSTSVTKLLRGVLSNQLSGEDYSDSANNTYLYRSYTDIASYAQYIYQNVGVRGHIVNSTDSLYRINGHNDISLGDYFSAYTTGYGLGTMGTSVEGSLDLSESLGFNYNTSLDEINNARFYYFNRSNSLAKATSADFNTLSSEYDAFGVPTSLFNFTLADFNSSMLLPAERTSLGVFAIYSESPYYYLNWNIRDQLYSSAIGGSYPIKSLLLKEDNGMNSYFYNTSNSLVGSDGYGQVRDYMDMRSLFTVVIPYLKACNDAVVAFDDRFELKMIGDYAVTYTTNADGTMSLDIPVGLNTLTDDNKDAYYSYWHDVQVSNLFNMYTPWVDSMYACSYAKPEKVTVAGINYVIKDPLNPASYPVERPMIFSESERLYYGLTLADLTEVEKHIISLNTECYNSLVSLMNYYSFDKDVLISAMAMMETFVFNKEFSETPMFGDSNVLYPQGFELKNFSFDAYFRLILSETTSIDLNSSTSIYETVVKDTSLFTAVLILIVDLTSVWAVPFLRLAVVVLLFIMSVITVLSSCIVRKSSESLDFKGVLKSLGSSVVAPLIKFVSATVICAWVISLLLSSGYTGVTGKLDYTISLEDPILAMVSLLVVNAVLVVVYAKIVIKMLKDCKGQVKGIVSSVQSVGAGLCALGLGAIVSKSDNAVVSDVSAPNKGASNVIKPKLKISGSASEKLAKKELQSKRADKAKSVAGKVASAVTKPVRNIQESRAYARRAEEAQQAAERQKAEEREKMETQAKFNANALLDEQERRVEAKREQERIANENRRKAKERERAEAEARRQAQVNEGMRQVKEKQARATSNQSRPNVTHNNKPSSNGRSQARGGKSKKKSKAKKK